MYGMTCKTQRKLQCFKFDFGIDFSRNLSRWYVDHCKDRRIYSREIMPIYLNKCSYIYAPKDKGRRAITVSFWELAQPFLATYPPTNNRTKSTSNIIWQALFSRLSHYTHCLQLSLWYQCMAAITQGKDKRERIRRIPRYPLCWILSGLIMPPSHIQNMMYKGHCTYYMSLIVFYLYVVLCVSCMGSCAFDLS